MTIETAEFNDNDATQKPLETIAEALLEIGETLESILALMQEREEGFKARNARTAATYGDRKPYGRKPAFGGRDRGDRNDDFGGDDDAPRAPRGRKPAGAGGRGGFGPKKSFGDKKSFGGGKRSFGAEKKPYKPRTPRDDGDSAPRKKYKGGY